MRVSAFNVNARQGAKLLDETGKLVGSHPLPMRARFNFDVDFSLTAGIGRGSGKRLCNIEAVHNLAEALANDGVGVTRFGVAENRDWLLDSQLPHGEGFVNCI